MIPSPTEAARAKIKKERKIIINPISFTIVTTYANHNDNSLNNNENSMVRLLGIRLTV